MERSAHGRVDHVGFAVPDLEEATRFLTEHLGATLEFSLDRFVDESGDAPARLGAPRGASFALAMLRIGEARIELLQWWGDEGAAAARGPHRTGAAHLAIEVPDVARSYAELGALPGVRALGGPVTFGEGPTPGLANAFVETPWGLLIELMSWPER